MAMSDNRSTSIHQTTKLTLTTRAAGVAIHRAWEVEEMGLLKEEAVAILR